MKGKRFELIQDIPAAMTAQLKNSRKRTSTTASESGKNDGISVFKVRGSILWGINGVSFTVINFFYLHIHHNFWITYHIKNAMLNQFP